MTTKYCMTLLSSPGGGRRGRCTIISENRKQVKSQFRKSEKSLGGAGTEAGAGENHPPRGRHFFAALRARLTALARSRSIWPLGSVTQISPIHSSFTPLIGLALKLVRLTTVADFPRSMVFR